MTDGEELGNLKLINRVDGHSSLIPLRFTKTEF